MIKDKSIYIKNIYYMLSYAFQVLKQSNYDEVASEEFENAQDLFAAILSKGVAQQLKHGLYRDYVTKNESLSIMRGKLDLTETFKNRIQRKQELVCEFDELSENNLLNQILKTTMHYLLINDGVDVKRKATLKKELVFFDGINQLEPSQIQWSKLYYQRNNKNYEMLMNICYFVLEGMLQTTDKGEYKMMAFSDDNMARLYEKFILEYYRQHHKYLTEVSASQVKWNLVGDISESMVRFLPAMQTDIFLRLDDKALIIDAKYYGQTLQKQYDKYTLHSNNLYQIFTYVKNQDKDNTGNIAGILLYAKTDEDITPDCNFNIGGNQFGAKTLDLNKEFSLIAKQLDEIAWDYFGLSRIIKLQSFAKKYLTLYENNNTTEHDVCKTFADECFALEINMDCGKLFEETTGYALIGTYDFIKVFSKICNADFLASAIFSKWRYITHWSESESCTEKPNRQWFVEAFKRLSIICACKTQTS